MWFVGAEALAVCSYQVSNEEGEYDSEQDGSRREVCLELPSDFVPPMDVAARHGTHPLEAVRQRCLVWLFGRAARPRGQRAEPSESSRCNAPLAQLIWALVASQQSIDKPSCRLARLVGRHEDGKCDLGCRKDRTSILDTSPPLPWRLRPRVAAQSHRSPIACADHQVPELVARRKPRG